MLQEFKKHLKKSSEIVSSWPQWKQEILGGSAVDIKYNSGVKCDMIEGPCACGAWHSKMKNTDAFTPFVSFEHRTELALRIKEAAYLEGDFTLRSGRKSKYYLDKYLFETQPNILAALGKMISQYIGPSINLIAGSELGSVPLATCVSLQSNKPFVIIRTHKKDYGTSKLYEGQKICSSDNILLIEDVVTTGEQVIKSAEIIKNEGAAIECIISVIDREEGARQNIEKAGFKFVSIFTTKDIINAT